LRVVGHSLAALAALAAAPLGVGVLALRPSWRIGLSERLGRTPVRAPDAVWIHGASVGEILAASRIIDRILKAGTPVLCSTVTLSGREVMRAARPEIPCHLAPLDHPWCVEAALERVSPAALVLIETELWPSWIAAAARRKVPVLLVSGRISDRTYPRYRRLSWIVRPTLRRLAAIGARTPTDRDRFIALGADPSRVSVTGDLKVERDLEVRPVAEDISRALAGSAVFVAGSTHAGEEIAALAALDECERGGRALSLVLAPRRPERATEVLRIVRRAGRRARRRTALGETPLASGEVLVLDTLGELAPLYSLSSVAFVGGSLVPRGGHNILEPVFAGRPVLYGKHTSNVRHAVEIVAASGAGRCVDDPRDLGQAVRDELSDLDDARRRGEQGRAALEHHRGSAKRVATLIDDVLMQRMA
jgi:3-deoxy-D-manno-octulosonic-acid transferase